MVLLLTRTVADVTSMLARISECHASLFVRHSEEAQNNLMHGRADQYVHFKPKHGLRHPVFLNFHYLKSLFWSKVSQHQVIQF